MNQTAVATQSDVAGSYLTFHLPRAKYALPVDSIQYITTLDAIDPHDVPGGKSGIRRMFTYEGTQIPRFFRVFFFSLLFYFDFIFFFQPSDWLNLATRRM